MAYKESLDSCAVYVNNLCKTYRKAEPVLQNFCMNVKKGTIYGLLGSSGCGKTTIISCIVGLTKWDSGNLLVFGKKPRPGQNVGYMPQELSLYNYLSVKETVQFYGKVYNLEAQKLKERSKYLTKLLQLASASQRVGELSGGQKRRVSLAIALLRSPDLLVLDEPTVGLDPLLRIKIWNYLYTLVNTLGITVILTTHYTEEVRHSDTIGVMREGRLILQENPDNLLRHYNSQFLEHAVLQLCRKDKQEKIDIETNASTIDKRFKTGFFRKVDEFNCDFNGDLRIKINSEGMPTKSKSFPTNRATLQKVYALTILNLVNCIRTPTVLIPTLFSNAITIVLSVLILGTKPKDLALGVINNEVNNWPTTCNFPIKWTNSCDIIDLSCKFLSQVKNNDIITLNFYQTEEKALIDAHLGKIRGFLKIPQNYSQHVLDFGIAKQFSPNETLQGSKIYARLDYSEYIASYYVINHLLESYLEFTKQVAVSCGMNRKETEIPLKFHALGNSSRDDSFTSFMLPGIVLSSMLAYSCVLTGLDIINDRKQGTFSRAVVAGISFVDLLFSNLATQFILNVIQILSVAGIYFFVFSYTIVGSRCISLIICLLVGQCATCLGILVGIFCNEQVDIVVFGMSSFVLTLLYGGVVWPSECMAKTFRYLGHLLPASYPAQSLRYVVHRGLQFWHPLVWPGFAAVLIWASLLIFGSFIGYRRLHK